MQNQKQKCIKYELFITLNLLKVVTKIQEAFSHFDRNPGELKGNLNQRIHVVGQFTNCFIYNYFKNCVDNNKKYVYTFFFFINKELTLIKNWSTCKNIQKCLKTALKTNKVVNLPKKIKFLVHCVIKQMLSLHRYFLSTL